MYTRRLELPSRTFSLFGPRGTGKTTWLRTVLPQAVHYDLLDERLVARLARQPESIRPQVEALPAGSGDVLP